MKIVKALMNKWILINLGAALVLALFALLYVTSSLNSFTRHGEDGLIHVPDFGGLALAQAQVLARENGLEVEVMDSIYNSEFEKGAVLDQHPRSMYSDLLDKEEKKRMVKENRTIYLTVNSILPKPVILNPISYVNLRDNKRYTHTARTYMNYLNMKGINYTLKTRRGCAGCLWEVRYKGEKVTKSMEIKEGEEVVLVVGEGLADAVLPNLEGMSIDRAKKQLKYNKLKLGDVRYEECATSEDSLAARVYKQTPKWPRASKIGSGTPVSIYLKP